MDFFDRFIELTVDDKKFDSDNFDIFFTTNQGGDENDAEITIWNLSRTTLFELKEEQFIHLKAGYREDFGTVFTGTVKDIWTSRDNADRKTVFNCTSKQFEVRNEDAIIEAYNPETVTAAISRIAVEQGLSIGYISTDAMAIGTGGICFLNTGDFLDWAADKISAEWFLLNSPLQVGATLYMVKSNDTIPKTIKLVEVPYIINDERDEDERRITVPLTWEAITGSIINFTAGEDLKIGKIKHESNRSKHTTELLITLTTGKEPGEISIDKEANKELERAGGFAFGLTL